MKLNIAKLNTKGIKKVAQIDLSKERDYIEIELEDMTKEELEIYKEHKRNRNRRVYKNKFGVDYDERM